MKCLARSRLSAHASHRTCVAGPHKAVGGVRGGGSLVSLVGATALLLAAACHTDPGYSQEIEQLLRTDPVVALLNRLERSLQARDLQSVHLDLTPICRASCSGMAPLLVSESGGYQVARWIRRQVPGGVMGGLAAMVLSYETLAGVRVEARQLRRYPRRALVRAAIDLWGIDRGGARRADHGLWDLDLVRRRAGWRVDQIRPTRVYSLRREDDGYVAGGKASPPAPNRGRQPVAWTIPGRRGDAPRTLVGEMGRLTLIEARGREVWARALGPGGRPEQPARRLLRLERGPVRALLARDFDGDGQTDLYVGSFGGGSGLWVRKDHGGYGRDGRWNVPGPVTAVAAADFDGNGWLDLYAVRHGRVQARPPGGGLANVMLLGGTEGPRRRPMAADSGWGLDACVGDLDDDARPDLVVANEFGRSTVWINRGAGRFVESSVGSGVDVPALASACAIGDVDGDRQMDIYLGGRGTGAGFFIGRPGVRTPGAGLWSSQGPPGIELLHRGGALWVSLPRRGGRPRWRRQELWDPRWVSGAAFVDHDGDGDLDLWTEFEGVSPSVQTRWWWDAYGRLLRGLPPLHIEAASAPSHAALWLNTAHGEFVSAGWVADLSPRRLGSAPALFDVDADGRLDWITATASRHWKGGRVDLGEPGATHGVWLRLRGRDEGNGDAVGARVELSSEGRRQIAEVGTGSGLRGAPAGYVYFGVGEHVRVQWLRVRWPDGSWQRFIDLPVDALVTLVQGGHASWKDLEEFEQLQGQQ